jgi:heptosyltransferase-2
MPAFYLRVCAPRSFAGAASFIIAAMLRPPFSPRRVLILKWSALGDVAIASAIIDDLVRAWPQAEFHLHTLPASAGLFAHDPRFASVFTIPVRERGRRLRRSLEWLRMVIAGHYDLLVDLQSNDHSRLLVGLLALSARGPAIRAGNWGGWPFNVPVAIRREGQGSIVIMHATLRALGVRPQADAPVLAPAPDATERVAALCAAHALSPGRFVIFLPGSNAAGWLKRWGAERYAALARQLLKDGLADRVALVGGGDEVEECAQIAASDPARIVNLNGALRLLDIPVLAATARAIVGNDTGPGHLAACARKPMLILCGPTDPERVKPFGPRVHTLQADLPCINCYGKTCRIGTHACMSTLTAEQVAARLAQLLA